jgi:acetoin utilization protein AcuB
MTANQLINPSIPSLKLSDITGKALDWMEEFRVGQLAIIEDGNYKGLLPEDVVLDLANDNTPISEIQPVLEDVFALDHQHIYELIALTQEHQLDILPVLDDAKQYVGTVVTTDLLKHFAQDIGTQETGAIIVLHLEQRDYSLAEISRLVEQNRAKIINSFYTTQKNSFGQTGKLTLKLNRTDIVAIVATLERFGYEIEEIFANEAPNNPAKERIDILLKYLSI